MTVPLIIGSGPAGRAAAATLAAAGLSSVLVDQRAEALQDVAANASHKLSTECATAFHAEPGRLWLWSQGSVTQRTYSHLVIATGAAPVTGSVDATGAQLASGAVPEVRLAALLGCAFRFDPIAEWLLVDTNSATLETSVPGVFVVGAAKGGVGEGSAERDASLCAQHILGNEPSEVGHSEPAVRTWSGGSPRNVADNVEICPSCGVSAGEVRAAAASGADNMEALGRLTGAAEGACRGAGCTVPTSLILADALNRPLEAVLCPPTEFPAAPIPIDLFAAITPVRPEARSTTPVKGVL